MNEGNLISVLSGVIRGVIDGDITPAQANAACNATGQIIKIARIKIEHESTLIDGVTVPQTLAIASDESIERRVFGIVSHKGAATFRDLANECDIAVDQVSAVVSTSEQFRVEGNTVYLAS